MGAGVVTNAPSSCRLLLLVGYDCFFSCRPQSSCGAPPPNSAREEGDVWTARRRRPRRAPAAVSRRALRRRAGEPRASNSLPSCRASCARPPRLVLAAAPGSAPPLVAPAAGGCTNPIPAGGIVYAHPLGARQVSAQERSTARAGAPVLRAASPPQAQPPRARPPTDWCRPAVNTLAPCHHRRPARPIPEHRGSGPAARGRASDPDAPPPPSPAEL